MDSSGQVKWTWSREKSCQIKWNQIKSIQVKAVKSPGLTRAIRPAPTPISGLAATMTSVSFHPFTKPMQKPHTNVVKRCRNMATWSAMASLILLMSLQHRRDRFNTHTHRNSRNTLYSGDRVITVPLTLTCECWAPLRRCSQTSRSPSSSLCWSTFLWWVWSAWQRTSPTGRSVSS